MANIISVVKTYGRYGVVYDSGLRRSYSADKLPKTVQTWLDAKVEEEKREAAAEKRRTAFAMRDRHEDVTTYTEWNDRENRLTEEELAWFHETADRCKAATGCTVPITTFDHEIFCDQSKEALGQCITNNPENPMEGKSQITIDNFFIHEKYLEAFKDFPCIEPQTLIGTICHEIAHLYVWEHGEEHDRKTQELLEMVEAYGADQEAAHEAEESETVQEKETEAIQKPEKKIKVEWCENWIKARFAKLPPFANGIYTGLFWKNAEESGLYKHGTYGTPMSEALERLCIVVDVLDEKGCVNYSAFKLKGAILAENERSLSVERSDPDPEPEPGRSDDEAVEIILPSIIENPEYHDTPIPPRKDLPVKTQKGTMEPVRHRRASEAVAFGICMAFAVLAHGLIELVSLLAIMIDTGWALAKPRARAGVKWIRENGFPMAVSGSRMAARVAATAVWYLWIVIT